jgi:hypothetical protein
MIGNTKLDFLLEIVKVKTSTRQEAINSDEHFCMISHCPVVPTWNGNCNYLTCQIPGGENNIRFDDEARDEDQEESTVAVYDGAEEQRDQPSFDQPPSHEYTSRIQTKSSSDRLIIKGYDYYGNPIYVPLSIAALSPTSLLDDEYEPPTDPFCDAIANAMSCCAKVQEQSHEQSQTRTAQSPNSQEEDYEPPIDPFCEVVGSMLAKSAVKVKDKVKELTSKVQHKSNFLSTPLALRDRVIIKGYDYYGNPIYEDGYSSKADVPQLTVEDGSSSFLEFNPKSSHHLDDDVNQSSVAKLIECFTSSLTCHAGKVKSKNKVADVKGPIEDIFAYPTLARNSNVNDMYNSYQSSSRTIELNNMMLEIQLRNEMANIQLQTEEMELTYQREIAHQIAAKALLQAQLHAKLVRVKEERQLMAAQLTQKIAYANESLNSTVIMGPTPRTAAAETPIDSKVRWGPTPRSAAAETPVVTAIIPKARTSKNMMTAGMTPTFRSPDPTGYYLSRTNE